MYHCTQYLSKGLADWSSACGTLESTGDVILHVLVYPTCGGMGDVDFLFDFFFQICKPIKTET